MGRAAELGCFVTQPWMTGSQHPGEQRRCCLLFVAQPRKSCQLCPPCQWTQCLVHGDSRGGAWTPPRAADAGQRKCGHHPPRVHFASGFFTQHPVCKIHRGGDGTSYLASSLHHRIPHCRCVTPFAYCQRVFGLFPGVGTLKRAAVCGPGRMSEGACAHPSVG